MASKEDAVRDAVQGESLRLSGNYSQAIRLFTAAIKAKEDYWWAYAHRAAARAALGNFAGAYKDFGEARRYYKDSQQFSWFLAQKAELFRLWARATLLCGSRLKTESDSWVEDEDVAGSPEDAGRADYEVGNERPAGMSPEVAKAFLQMSHAIRLFKRAHDQVDSNPWILAHLGATHTMRYWVGCPNSRFARGSDHDFDAGEEAFQAAYGLNSAYGWAYAFHAVLVGLSSKIELKGRDDQLDRAMQLIGKATMNGMDRSLSLMRIMMELATYRAGKLTVGDEARTREFERAVGFAWQTLQIDNEEGFARYFVANNVSHMSGHEDDDARHAILRARAELKGLRARIIAMEGGLDCIEGNFTAARAKLRYLERNFDFDALSLVRRDPAWGPIWAGGPRDPVEGAVGLLAARKQYRRLFSF